MPALPRHSLIFAALAAVIIAGAVAGALAATSSSAGSSAVTALRTVKASAGTMVVTGTGMTVYIYLPDQTRPSETTCTGDCANDWPPVLSVTPIPKVEGIGPSRIGLVTRPNGTHQLTLNGYPLYRFAADRKPGETRGESVGNTWFAVGSDGSFVDLTPAGFQPIRTASSQLIQVLATTAGQLVADSDGQTLYTYKDDTPTTSACIASWCTQDWPPVLVKGSPDRIKGITASLGVLHRPDGTLQLTLDGHPLYRFSGDGRSGDLHGLGIGQDWYPVGPDGVKVVGSPS